MKKRIYFLINSLEWWWAERVVTTLARHLLAEYDVDIIALKDKNFYDLPKWVNYIPLNKASNNILMLLMLPRSYWKLKRLLNNNQYDAWVSFLELANFLHILSKKKVTISVRNHIGAFRWFVWWIYRCFIRWLYPRADKIIVNSQENSIELARYLDISPAKIQAIYNPVDRDRILKLSQEPIELDLEQHLQNKQVFITIGRLVWQKNHRTLLYALAALPHRDWIYLIVWDGSKRWELQHLAEKLWIEEQVVWLGRQSNVFAYLAKADYFVYASKVEWFPNVLIEALTLWIPIITSNFKTWAQEIMLWDYDPERVLNYPVYWQVGVLLDPEQYISQFVEVLSHPHKMTANTTIDDFEIENILLQRKILFDEQ